MTILSSCWRHVAKATWIVRICLYSSVVFFLLEIFIFIYLCGCGRSQLQQAESFSCSRWDLDPWPGTEPRPPALGEQSLSHCTTNEVPLCAFLIIFSSEDTYSLLRLPWWLRQWRICLQCGRPGFDPWVGKIPLEEEMATHSSIFAWRIPWMEGYSPWGHKELDTTEQLTLSLLLLSSEHHSIHSKLCFFQLGSAFGRSHVFAIYN